MAQCAFKTEKGRQCKLDVHPDSTPHRFMRPRQALSAVLPAGFVLKAERVKEGGAISKAAGRKASGVRDQDQLVLDKEAKASYDAWVKAGKPDFMDKSKRHLYALNYVVPPKAVDGVLAALRATTDSGSLLAGKVFRYTKGMHESGNKVIQAGFVDPKE